MAANFMRDQYGAIFVYSDELYHRGGFELIDDEQAAFAVHQQHRELDKVTKQPKPPSNTVSPPKQLK